MWKRARRAAASAAFPAPLDRAWGDTSIRGHVSRGSGILNNERYAGVLVWNRQRFVKDPATGKRVSRPNPESQWIRTEVPHLRVVDDALWQAARDRQQQISAIFGPNPATTREGREYNIAEHASRARRGPQLRSTWSRGASRRLAMTAAFVLIHCPKGSLRSRAQQLRACHVFQDRAGKSCRCGSGPEARRYCATSAEGSEGIVGACLDDSPNEH
ncbi:recombinase family protein [Methylosinus sp. PW1]|uniref:recombinase family protein n=1 Tax=Methylosinus sp. PW1 TaxID=107636 RepID=UPI003526A6A2